MVYKDFNVYQLYLKIPIFKDGLNILLNDIFFFFNISCTEYLSLILWSKSLLKSGLVTVILHKIHSEMLYMLYFLLL